MASKGELIIAEFLRSNRLPFETEKTFDGCVSPDTKCKLKYDFYIESLKLLIEYDGEFHFRLNPHSKDPFEDLYMQQIRDATKTLFAYQNGLHLIRVLSVDKNEGLKILQDFIDLRRPKIIEKEKLKEEIMLHISQHVDSNVVDQLANSLEKLMATETISLKTRFTQKAKDSIKEFIESDRVDRTISGNEVTIFGAYLNFCSHMGYEPATLRDFKRKIVDFNCHPKTIGNNKMIINLGIRPQMTLPTQSTPTEILRKVPFTSKNIDLLRFQKKGQPIVNHKEVYRSFM